ncbi:Hsp20 family protein [Arenibaculum pallidiluteum]|uniref:Hsp20 family protein n=1 Tax=Arenibaculum pallidiluteum TaxID=2812559 RepID=UPI001A96C2B1|nr:Hsp20 family protein [Arenibaculum pallidiluteum]
MRSVVDFSPLYRSLIGFDRLVDLLDEATRLAPVDSIPHYDIEKTGEDSYRITLAVAGFGPHDIEVSTERNVLRVRGRRKEASTSGEVLHRGIVLGDFERRFDLADYVRVERANLDGGLLRIELVRELPEAMRPRQIPIGTAAPGADQTRQIEQKVA